MVTEMSSSFHRKRIIQQMWGRSPPPTPPGTGTLLEEGKLKQETRAGEKRRF